MLALAAVVQSGSAAPQSSTEIAVLRRDIEALRQGQAELREQLRELRGLLQAGAPRATASPPPREFDLGFEDSPFKGNGLAKVTLVEFSDYQCSFCARHVRQTLPEIQRDYIETGKLRYVYRDFPVSSHPLAFKAHEAAACAGEQGQYWAMHDRLFANQASLGAPALLVHAERLGLGAASFGRCLDEGRYAERVRKGLADGRAAGVTGTPTYFLGLTVPDIPTIRVARTIRGAKPYAVFKEAIEALLAESARRGEPGPAASPARSRNR